jgi:putative transposase
MGRSAHDVRKSCEEFPHRRTLPSLWTRSFFLSTAGNVSQELSQRCIERPAKT